MRHIVNSNPIVVSKDLRRKLLEGSIRQEVPYLWEDDWHVFFDCIRCGLKASSGEEEPPVRFLPGSYGNILPPRADELGES